jgi:non-canonical poly(A) RNA polymerase PAPD5/7
VLNGIVSGLKKEEEKGKAKANTTFEMGEDFISFAPPSEDEKEEKKGRGDEERASVREWDRDKGKMRASDRDRGRDKHGSTQKRKYDYVFDDEELANANEKLVEMMLPKTPWVSKVDWENCSNVTEMCVLLLY